MSEDRMFNSIRMLYGEADTNRINWKQTNGEKIEITVDLHQMNRVEGKRFIKNIIAIFRATPFTLEIIHGYNHGTVLKEMIHSDKISNRIMNITSPSWNPGISVLDVAA